MFFTRKLPVYIQSEAAECGLACLGMAAAYWGKEIDLPSLRRQFPISMQGARLNDLMSIAERLDMTTRALKVDLDALQKISVPAILHWEFNHFVVLKKITNKYAVIHDPAVGERKLSIEAVSQAFTGIVLEVGPGAEFKREKVKSTIRLGHIMRGVRGITRPLIQVVCLSLFIQIVALLTPFFMQLSIDHVVPTSDKDLLWVLALGFAVVFTIGPLFDWLRARLVVFISTQFSAQMTSNIVRYLLDLPLTFFEKRSIGDLLARLDASDRLRDLLTQGFVTAAVDVLFALFTLGMMFYYNVTLGMIAVITTGIVIVLRLAFIPTLKRLVNETLQKKGLEQSELIESMRGIASVKLNQKEQDREAIWNNRFSSFLNSSAELEAAQANYTFAKDLVINISIVALGYLGIKYVIDTENAFTLGALIAFASYRQLFFDRISSFLELMIEYSLSKVHLERLGEILSEEAERPLSEFHKANSKFEKIELREASYQFSPESANVLQDLNLSIDQGDRIVLFGPSGTGKSTLLKMIAGVYGPTQGQVRLNGVDVAAAGHRFLRENIATVLQDDYLFKGSILDNITFFDRVPDYAFAQQCAKLACIHDVIEKMPMSYETLIGEMGSSLSQGQQQRVLLARALYQKKPLLILDEGTAHLDEVTEKNVLKNLKRIGATVLMTAHKSSLAEFGTRIWHVTPGGNIDQSEAENLMTA